MTAGEHALRLLEGEERATAQRRMLADRAFAAEVMAWRARLGDLIAEIPDVEPPAGLLARIEASLEPQVSAAPVALRLWQAWAGIATAAAAVLAFLLLQPRPAPNVPAPAPMMVAQLMPTKDSGTMLAASYDPGQGMLRVRHMGTAEMPSGKMEELWLIPGDGVPRALAVLDPDRPTDMPMPAAMARHMAEGVTLAVTMERKRPGLPSAPGGPITAKGMVTRV